MNEQSRDTGNGHKTQNEDKKKKDKIKEKKHSTENNKNEQTDTTKKHCTPIYVRLTCVKKLQQCIKTLHTNICKINTC